MDYVLVSITALLVAVLTFFSGFGLGTLLLPVFAVFFPIEIAIAATAIVHLANNIFKVILVGKHADKKTSIKFAIPAVAGAFIGALLLNLFIDLHPLASYSFLGNVYYITPLKTIIAFLMVIFSIIELIPFLSKFSFNR